MTKPTKAQLIQIRKESYREQVVECCGTCRYFVPYYMVSHNSGPLRGQVESRCEAIRLRGDVVPHRVEYLNICDLYEPRKDVAK